MEGLLMTEDANSNFFPAKDTHDLYTIPSSSAWFCWDEIHETERTALKEFFHGFSISKTPKIYKEYRDFIINKFREDPKRRLTFTEIRKSLVGDVCLVYKVFCFLEKWSLINYGVGAARDEEKKDKEKEVRFEEGGLNGVKVVEVPNSVRPVSLMPVLGENEEVRENGFRLPPLASYKDVFDGNKLICAKCGSSEANKKHGSATCLKCVRNEDNGKSKATDDSTLKDCKDSSVNHGADTWTDAETLLLLESVLTHGDDWDLVAQDVQSKDKSECISRLIQLPFGDLMLSTINRNGYNRNANGNTSSTIPRQSTSYDPQASIEECIASKQTDENKQINGGAEGPPLKRRCIELLPDAGDSLMKQVALLSTAVSPHVAASAAEAAITALCEENPFARMILEGEEENVINMLESPTTNNGPERLRQSEGREATPEKNSVSLTLRIRTSIGTALGAAAANAKLLADQEDREVERLVATVIETQLKKIHCKIKHFEELQVIMEKEYSQIQELKESIIEDRIDVLRHVFGAGISRWKDHSSVKPFTGSVC